MRRALIVVVSVVASLAAAIAGAGTWLLYTESGLVWSLARAHSAAPGLAVRDASGTWAHGVAAAGVEFKSNDLLVAADNVELVLSPWSVLLARPRIAAFIAKRVEIVMLPGEKRAGAPDSIALPVAVDIAMARIGELIVDRDGQRNTITDIVASYAGGPREHEIRLLEATHDIGRLQARGTIAARSPFEVSAQARVSLDKPGVLAIDAEFAGTLMDLAVQGNVRHAAGTADIKALLTPFAETPLASLDIAAQEIDLRRFADTLPRTRLSLTAALSARGNEWIGPVHLRNALPGPWDKALLPVASLNARVAATRETAVLDAIEIGLPGAGKLSGRATANAARLDLHLDAHAVDLRALHSALRQTALRGHVDAAIEESQQSASAQLTQQDIQLAFDAVRAGDDLRVPRFRASTRGSEARGAAQLSLAGARRYTANATLTGFDPSAWGDFPDGSISGRLDVEGALEREEVRVRYALDRSQLLGASLAGNGTLAYARQRITAAHLQLTWGGNRIAADGAFGAPGDTLAVRIDAANLAIADKRVAGAVTGTMQLSGAWRAPRIQADLNGRALAYADEARAGSATLRGELKAGDVLGFRVALGASRVQAAGWTGDRVDIEANGTEQAHTLALRAKGGDLDFALQARGGWQRAGHAWSGVVEQARNSAPVAFAIAAPVDVAFSPRRVSIGPFAARLMGGELAVAGFRYRDGVLNSEGRFSQLPARPIAALAGIAMRPQDTLRLSGRWSVVQEARLAVAFAVERDSGDLTVGTSQPLALGLDTLRAEGRLVNGRLEMQSVVRSALASGTAEGSVATRQAGGMERIDKQSAVRFSSHLEIARLAALSGLIGSTAHLDGRVRADLKGTGTVGAPVVSGTVDADRLVVALPPQGIELRDGTLRATLQSNQIEVREFLIHGGTGTLTAQGRLAMAEGQRASLDWRAERLMVLARPDRRLVVTGSGNGSLERGKIALTGKLYANQGYFQFAETSLPVLGPDVIVAGRAPKQEEPPALSRAALDLTLDFGNDLRIVGYGLDAWIEGRVGITTDERGKLLARGTLRTQRGTYEAYGQRLQIERGQLAFGGPLDNPGLDILAMRKNQAVEAGVAVTGTVHAPLVRVVSDPPVAEGEALSWLVLGHGPADASRADLAMLPLAAAALFGQAKPGEGSFANKLGLDTLAVRGGGGGGGGGGGPLANQVLAVGKRISNKLYVIYEQGLGTATNALKVEYNLTRRFLLRAEAGQISAAGLFFRYAFD
ncbi:MAG: translocation/assembly module TamB domain-containing protein [Rhodospirillaceae bacterium]